MASFVYLKEMVDPVGVQFVFGELLDLRIAVAKRLHIAPRQKKHSRFVKTCIADLPVQ